jgi:hypothetical protein
MAEQALHMFAAAVAVPKPGSALILRAMWGSGWSAPSADCSTQFAIALLSAATALYFYQLPQPAFKLQLCLARCAAALCSVPE